MNEEMNVFLRSKKIMQIERAFSESGAAWSFCITYLEEGFTKSKGKAKIDYKEVLDAESFNRFSQMRVIRKMNLLQEKYNSGEWDEATCQRYALPLIAFTRHANECVIKRWYRSLSSYKHPPTPKGEYSSTNFKIRTYFEVSTTVLPLGVGGCLYEDKLLYLTLLLFRVPPFCYTLNTNNLRKRILFS